MILVGQSVQNIDADTVQQTLPHALDAYTVHQDRPRPQPGEYCRDDLTQEKGKGYRDDSGKQAEDAGCDGKNSGVVGEGRQGGKAHDEKKRQSTYRQRGDRSGIVTRACASRTPVFFHFASVFGRRINWLNGKANT